MRYFSSSLKPIITIVFAMTLILITDAFVGLIIEKFAKTSNEPLSFLYQRHNIQQKLHFVFGNSRSVPVQKNLLNNSYTTINMSTNSMSSSTIVAIIKTMIENNVLNKGDMVSIEASSIFNSDDCRAAPYASASQFLNTHYKNLCLKPIAYLMPNTFKLNTESFTRMIYSSIKDNQQARYPAYRSKNSDICSSTPTDLSLWIEQIKAQPESLSRKINDLRSLKDNVPKMQFFTMPFPNSGSIEVENKNMIASYLVNNFPDLKSLKFSKINGNDCLFFSDTLHINRLGGIKLGIQ